MLISSLVEAIQTLAPFFERRWRLPGKQTGSFDATTDFAALSEIKQPTFRAAVTGCSSQIWEMIKNAFVGTES